MTIAVTHTHDSPSAPPPIKALPGTFLASCVAGKAFSCSGPVRESFVNDPLSSPSTEPACEVTQLQEKSPRAGSRRKLLLCLCAICSSLSDRVLIKTWVWGFGYGFTYRSIYLNRFLILNSWIWSCLFEVFLLVIVVWVPHVPLT